MGWLGGAALLFVLVSGAVPNQPWVPSWSAVDSHVRQVTDVAGERTVWTWFNCTVLAAGGVAQALTGAVRRVETRRSWPWFVLAGVLFALSLDDLVALHERLEPLGRSLGAGEGLLTAAWVVPGAVVALLVVAAVAVVARHLPPVPRLLLVGGLAVFLGAAFGLELVSFAVLDGIGTGPVYVALVSLEELLEAWGAVLILASAVAAVRLSTDAGGVLVELRRDAPAPS